MNIVIGMTGASGSIYGRRLIRVLLEGGHTCHLVLSEAGLKVAEHELKEGPASWPSSMPGGERLDIRRNSDLFAPFCSGTNPPQAMVISPCSMGTLGRIASGISDSLITRAADVCLKERIPLLLVTREMPLNLIHLDNMSTVARAGGIIMPASPGFYHLPSSVADIVDFVTGKTLDALKISHNLSPRWGETEQS